MYSYSQGLQVDFNGTKLGSFSEINFTGAGVTVTNVNGVATVTIPGATGSNVTLGTRNIFVSKQGVDATGTPGDLALDYLTIGAAITAAIALTPSVTNPINIVVYTGTYAENITIPAFVNLISAEPLVFLYNASSYSSIASRYSDVKGYVYVNGTITQSGNNVNIVGINCNTLTISVGNSNSSYVGFVASTAILNTSATDSGIWYDVHAESFLANCAINGYHNYCTASSLSFGSSSTANSKNILGKMYNCIVDGVGGYASNTNIPGGFNAGNISGTMDNCVCNGNYSFASALGGNGGTIDGVVLNCTSNGNNSFAWGGLTGGDITGKMINCQGLQFAFASGGSIVGGTISGHMTNCRALALGVGCSFASGLGAANGGTISGILENCEGGAVSFASSFLYGGTISGKLYNCRSVGSTTFASAEAGGGVISGQLFSCTATGDISYASANQGVGAYVNGISGNLYSCMAVGSCSFCSILTVADGITTGTITGYLHDCIATGEISFGSVFSSMANKISGVLIDCIGADYSYCSTSNGAGGTISGKLTGCTGGTTCFASADVGNAGNILGILTNCSGIDICFCADFLVAGQMEGTLINCDAGTNYAFSLSTMYLGGKIIRCRSKPSVANKSAIIVAHLCTFEYCDFKGNGTGFGIASADGAIYDIDARFCSFYGTGIDPNLTNLTATPYNTDDVNSLY